MSEKERIGSTGSSIGKRHIQVLLLFLCVTIQMAARVCLSLSVVAMTDSTTSTNVNVPTYDWNNTNIILSSFFWGYLGPQFIAGQLVQAYGVKWFLFASTLANSLSMVAVPLCAATWGSVGVMVCRIFQGAGQGFLTPCMQTMLGRWAPENERSRLSMIVYSGSAMGIIFCGPINGYICESFLGWPWAFYLFGGVGFLWCISWALSGYSAPASHPSISLEERDYIETSLCQKGENKIPPTPWRALFTSLPFWSVVVANVGISFGGSFLSNDLNIYLDKIVGYNSSKNGILSSVPTFAGVVTNILFGFISDALTEKNYITKLNARRIFHLIGTYGPTAAMLILAYLPKSEVDMAIVYLSINGALASSQHFGVVINNIDIAPRYAGVIAGISAVFSTITSLLAPLLVQFLVTDEANVTQWRILFLISASFYFFPSTFFVICASADIQWWDLKSQQTESDVDKEQSSNKINRYS